MPWESPRLNYRKFLVHFSCLIVVLVLTWNFSVIFLVSHSFVYSAYQSIFLYRACYLVHLYVVRLST